MARIKSMTAAAFWWRRVYEPETTRWRWRKCGSCGDRIRREPMWKISQFSSAFADVPSGWEVGWICMDCAKTKEEAELFVETHLAPYLAHKGGKWDKMGR